MTDKDLHKEVPVVRLPSLYYVPRINVCIFSKEFSTEEIPFRASFLSMVTTKQDIQLPYWEAQISITTCKFSHSIEKNQFQSIKLGF